MDEIRQKNIYLSDQPFSFVLRASLSLLLPIQDLRWLEQEALVEEERQQRQPEVGQEDAVKRQ